MSYYVVCTVASSSNLLLLVYDKFAKFLDSFTEITIPSQTSENLKHYTRRDYTKPKVKT